MDDKLSKSRSNNFWGLEEKLESALRPVSPDPVFVDALKLKLTHTPAVIMESGRRHIGLAVLLVGVLAGSLVFWLSKKFRA